jgi:hypothetical protein
LSAAGESIETVVFDQTAGLDTITGFTAAEDFISYEAVGTGNGGEVVVTTAGAQAALTDDNTYVVEQTVGAAAALTTGGTEVIADFTDMADVAAYLDEAFTNSGNAGNVIVLNDGTSSYIYQAIDAGADTSLVGEITLIGTVDDVLTNVEVAQA